MAAVVAAAMVGKMHLATMMRTSRKKVTFGMSCLRRGDYRTSLDVGLGMTPVVRMVSGGRRQRRQRPLLMALTEAAAPGPARPRCIPRTLGLRMPLQDPQVAGCGARARRESREHRRRGAESTCELDPR